MNNRVENLVLKVWEQKKMDNGIVMRCSKSGKKKEDGTYEKSLPVNVMIDFGDSECEWSHSDLTSKLVLASGTLSHSFWESNGKSGVNLTVWADKVELYEPNNNH